MQDPPLTSQVLRTRDIENICLESALRHALPTLVLVDVFFSSDRYRWQLFLNSQLAYFTSSCPGTEYNSVSMRSRAQCFNSVVLLTLAVKSRCPRSELPRFDDIV